MAAWLVVLRRAAEGLSSAWRLETTSLSDGGFLTTTQRRQLLRRSTVNRVVRRICRPMIMADAI